MNRIEKEAAKKKSFAFSEFMLEEAKRFLLGMKTLWQSVHQYEQPSDLALRMISAWESLRLRATSHEDDRFICFAAICAVGYRERERISSLLSYPPEQRFKAWMQIQSAVPAGLLFVTGPRYDEKGFRWIPKGVWRQPLFDTDVAVGDQESNELVFKKPGFLVYSPQFMVDRFLISDRVSSLLYYVTSKGVGFLDKHDSAQGRASRHCDDADCRSAAARTRGVQGDGRSSWERPHPWYKGIWRIYLPRGGATPYC